MKNITTPRTLAECRFDVGYPDARIESTQARLEAFLSVLLACAIGIFFAVCYVVWWSV